MILGGIPEGCEVMEQSDLRDSVASPLGNYTYLPSRFSGSTAYALREEGPDGLKVTRDAHRWLARSHGRRELWQ